MSNSEAIKEAILDIEGPWLKVESGLSTGPKEWWTGPNGVAIEGSPSRVNRESVRWRDSDHIGRPPLLAHGEKFIVWGVKTQPDIQRPEDPLSIINEWKPGLVREAEGTVKELLCLLSGDNDTATPEKLLARCGIKRKAAARVLGHRLSIKGHWGDTLGGISADWIVYSEGRHLALNWGRSMEGFWEVDYATVQLGLDLSGADYDKLSESERLFFFFAALREMNYNGDPSTVKSLAEPWLLSKEPEMVYVDIIAPEWVNLSNWLPDNHLLKPSSARWLIHNIHGVTIDKTKIQVTCSPQIRAGNKPQRREPLDIRRRRLFSRWFEGVQVDDTGLYSATPEALAIEFTNMASGVVFDATCGVGSMAIAAALNPRVSKVIAVDTDASRLDMAKHNAKIYGVLDRLEFIHGDSNEIISDHSPNLVIADPPWGGRDWNREHTDLNSLGMSLEALLDARCEVIIKLPLSFDLASLPGNWAPTAMIDSRGIIKFIKVTRVGTHS